MIDRAVREVSRLPVRAFAKVNLALDLLGVRDDGYTEIATVFQSIDLADEIVLEIVPGPEEVDLTVVGGPEPCPADENLAVRAARAFGAAFGLGGRLFITLEKHIPAGAGLGGGSADAAAVLSGLAQLHRGAVGPARLAELGARLGADVPFFLVGGMAIGRGRGDIVEPLPDAPVWPLTLVLAGPPLSTAEVYRRARARLTTRRDAPNILRLLQHLRETPHDPPPVGNDLLPAAATMAPLIPQVQELLGGMGGRAGMTGSGVGVFALFRDEQTARAAARAVEERWPEAAVYTTRTRPGGRG